MKCKTPQLKGQCLDCNTYADGDMILAILAMELHEKRTGHKTIVK